MTNPTTVILLKSFITLLFLTQTFYFIKFGLREFDGCAHLVYSESSNDPIGLRSAWQTPYHIGTFLQVLVVGLSVLLNSY